MEIRKLIPSDVDALLALQTRLHDGMAHSEWLADTDRQQFDEILSGCGYGEGVFEDGKMLGAWVLYYPPKGAHCLGDIIGLPARAGNALPHGQKDDRARGGRRL